MIQVRNGVFETNSSSQHTIAISKHMPNVEDCRGATINFTLGEYGWEFDTVVDTASYLYTALTELYNDWPYYSMDEKFVRAISHIVDVLEKYGVQATFQTFTKDSDFYIDHSYELIEFLSDIMVDDDMLIRFLLNHTSCVHTGNDNRDYDEDAMCERGEHIKEDDDYRYYYKGN